MSQHNEDTDSEKRAVIGATVCVICLIATVVVCTSIGGLVGFLKGIASALGIAVLISIVFLIWDRIGERNSAKRDKSMEIQIKMEEDMKIRKVDEEVKKRIENALYDKNLQAIYHKLISTPSNIDPVVDYSILIFKRMISHADSDSSKKFIECNFTYVVTAKEIKYLFDSEYTNPRDDFNFEKQRFRNLQYDYECEGLALALAQAVSNKMKLLYPPNTLSITISNVNSRVKMNFKAPNENFVVARDFY